MGLRVVVAEDALLVREGIVALLDAQPEIDDVRTCDDFDELVRTVDADPPDVVVTDICMPPTSTDEGIRAATGWRRSHPDLGVVVLSQYAEPAYALALFEDGSDRRAYLLKERLSDPAQLVGAIREVADGGSVVDPRVVDVLIAGRTRAKASPLRRLSPRETEVPGEIAQGKNNAGVAAALVISERAVEKHINALFAKLDLADLPDVHRRVKAVLLFLADQGG